MTLGRYAELFDSQAVLHLQQLEQHVPQLEQAGQLAATAYQECLRQLHSLKGMAQAMEMTVLSDTCHQLETILSQWPVLPWSRQQFMVVQLGIDALWKQVEAAQANEPLPQAPMLQQVFEQVQGALDGSISSPPSPLAPLPIPAMVDQSLLGATKSPAAQQIRSVESGLGDGAPSTALAVPAWGGKVGALGAMGLQESQPWQATLELLHDGLGEMLLLRQQVMANYGAHVPTPMIRLLEQWHTQVRTLQSKVQQARQLPLRSMWQRYPRMLRDLASKLGKQAHLQLIGDYLELDRDVLVALDNVLLHLLRNAIAHGIESPEQRQAVGKSSVGQIRLQAQRDGQAMWIEVEDDGIGLQPDLLRRTAVRKQLLTPAQAQTLTDEQACSLIFLAGFSTQDTLTELAGRGIGLDAVVSQLEASGGWIRVEQPKSGQGTLFVLRLPTSLATLPALLINIPPYMLAISVTKVAGVIPATRLHTSNQGHFAIDFHGKSIPYYPLHTLLAQEHPPQAISLVILVHAGPSLVALGIGGAISYQALSVKALQGPLSQLDWLTGVAILTDGTPIMMLDVVHILRKYQESQHA